MPGVRYQAEGFTSSRCSSAVRQPCSSAYVRCRCGSELGAEALSALGLAQVIEGACSATDAGQQTAGGWSRGGQ